MESRFFGNRRTPVATAASLIIEACPGGAELWKTDHASAYRQIPIYGPHCDFVVVTLLCPHDQKIYCFKPHTLLFGSSAAVLGYNLVARTIASAFVRAFLIPVIHFYDDHAGAAPPSLASLALELFQEFCTHVGIKCKVEKDEVGPQIGFLGVLVRGIPTPPVIALPNDKRSGYLNLIHSVLRARKCSPSTAAEMAGKLSFSTVFIWGRGPRVYLKALYRHSEGNSDVIGCALSASLQWWIRFLSEPISRTVSRPPVSIDLFVHTDASLDGLGVYVMRKGGRPVTYAAKTPLDFGQVLDKGANAIHALELAAALLGIGVVAGMCRAENSPLSTVMSIDNNAALASLLRGHTRHGYTTSIVQTFWSTQACGRIPIWLDRVRSAHNRADEPSRRPGGSIPLAFPSVFDFSRVF